MSRLHEATIPHNSAVRRAMKGKSEMMFSLRRSLRGARGLVVSSDAEVRRKLADGLWECGLASVVACSFFESALALSSEIVSVIVTQENLADAAYADLLEIANRSVPVIVVSPTGDWPEYLAAIRAGAFDYLPYPSIPGDLQRAVWNALGEHENVSRIGERTCTSIR